MFQIKIQKSDIPGAYYDTELVIDTGTSTVTVNLGIVHANDLEALAVDVIEEGQKALNKAIQK